MELRSHKNREAKDLQETLMNMGFYEKGMNLSEMRNMINALQESIAETDLDQAVKDQSELDWIQQEQELVLNSTPIHQQSELSGIPCEEDDNISLVEPAELIVTHAEVHHAMDWSPPRFHAIYFTNNEKRAERSFYSDCNGHDRNDEFQLRRQRLLTNLNDSGVNLSRERNNISTSSTHGSTSTDNDYATTTTTTHTTTATNVSYEERLQASSSSVAISNSSYSEQLTWNSSDSEPSL